MSQPAKVKIHKLPTGVRGLDEILGGGIPEFSFNIIAGTPGCGKTTLAHQIVFANATPKKPALYFTVLGEPALKMLRYQQQYSFFDEAKLGKAVRFINLSDVVVENGMDKETDRAAIWEIDSTTGAHRTVASGLRNPNGLAWEPVSGALWTVVNERDELGSDLVPDYLTAVKDGAFYGWPYRYYGQYIDGRMKPARPDLVAKAIAPDYALGTHVAPLGLTWSGSNSLPAQFANGMFIGQHGSWNRKPRSGYNVVFVPFSNGTPSGSPVEVLTGFVSAAGDAYGRPVGVAMDKRGALLVADDVGNVIWRVTTQTGR